MENRMDKVQILETTIGVLSEISVPVRLKEQIMDPIGGAINNLIIVLQMIDAESQANARHEEKSEDKAGNEEEPVKSPIVLKPADVGCPEEEAIRDEPEADPE